VVVVVDTKESVLVLAWRSGDDVVCRLRSLLLLASFGAPLKYTQSPTKKIQPAATMILLRLLLLAATLELPPMVVTFFKLVVNMFLIVERTGKRERHFVVSTGSTVGSM
jgi:hypothetical protein